MRYLRRIAKIRFFAGISDLTDFGAEERQKNCYFKAIGQHMTCLEARDRLF